MALRYAAWRQARADLALAKYERDENWRRYCYAPTDVPRLEAALMPAAPSTCRRAQLSSAPS